MCIFTYYMCCIYKDIYINEYLYIRFYLSDIWQSSDGMVWRPVQFGGPQTRSYGGGQGRGGFQMLSIPDPKGVPYLWVFGGRGCVHMRIYEYKYAYREILIRIYTHVYISIYVYAYVYAYIYIYHYI